MNKIIMILPIVLFLCSCSEPRKQLPYFDAEEKSSYEEDAIVSNVVSIPFREMSGVKFIQVTINGLNCEMIFDTGCSSTLISVAEANYLYEKGMLTEQDILGFTESMIADGSIVENVVVNLREVVIGGQISCENVKATVSNNSRAPLLLGNEILDRVSSFSVDNTKSTINFVLD